MSSSHETRQCDPKDSCADNAPSDKDTHESGITLAELLIAMGILTVVLVIFLAGIASMTKMTVRTEVTSDKVTQMRVFFTQLDREVRYARDINRPGRVGDKYYVEYVTVSPDADSAETCVQLRYVLGIGEVQRRSWPASQPERAGDFRTVVTQVRNNLSDDDQIPFVFYPAERDPATDITYVTQRLGVFLDAGLGTEGDGRGSQLDVVLTARNSSDLSQTHADSDNDGVTDDPVCTPGVGRP